MHAYMKELYVCMDTYVREPHEHSAVLMSVDECHMRVKQFPYMYFVRAKLWVSKCMYIMHSFRNTHTHTHKRIHICAYTKHLFANA